MKAWFEIDLLEVFEIGTIFDWLENNVGGYRGELWDVYLDVSLKGHTTMKVFFVKDSHALLFVLRWAKVIVASGVGGPDENVV